LVLGTLLYNEIIIFPYFGFDQWTKVAIAAREGTASRGPDADYMATSPGASYSSSRNLKLL